MDELKKEYDGKLRDMGRNQASLPQKKNLQVKLERLPESVDKLDKQAAGKRLIEYYKANPMKRKLKVSVIDSSSETDYTNQSYINKRPIQLSYKQLSREGGVEHIEPYYHNIVLNPIKKGGQAVVSGPYYNVRPSWWG